MRIIMSSTRGPGNHRQRVKPFSSLSLSLPLYSNRGSKKFNHIIEIYINFRIILQIEYSFYHTIEIDSSNRSNGNGENKTKELRDEPLEPTITISFTVHVKNRE
jgi:hypothetical protein